MDTNTLIAIISLSLTCFSLGITYGKDHKKKK